VLYSSPDLKAAEELLDESSLNTVLDIVEAIETAKELALLETLTSAQKRQVWAAISDEQKLRLKQIRNATSTITIDPITINPITSPEANESLEESALDLEVEELELPAELQDELEEIAHAELDSLMAEPSGEPDRPRAKVGDRVVLLPQPQLSSAELIAIWDVVEIQAEAAQIEVKHLGTRHYPLSWLVVYPEPDF
jgi:hypothetical protein